MRISCIGGGPASLYAALLFKKAHPDWAIDVTERNRPDDTFGWGVVFSDETLGNFEIADPESYAEIRRHFANWGDIDTWIGGTLVRSTGHGFCGLARKKLLEILQRRCRDVGVALRFETEVADLAQVRQADLVVAADGVHSGVRTALADHLRPTITWGRTRFCWLGTTKPLSAFTFIFRENEHGLFAVHAYPFEKGLSTFIVECAEETWKRAGLDTADEPTTIAYVAKLFADHLEGHGVLGNRSIWRRFPTIACERWSHENVVLLGDAVHTAHFSIGSGTKLAMEDAIALVKAYEHWKGGDPKKALAAYEAARRTDVSKIQRAAAVSQAWFEDVARWSKQDPVAFTFNLMTRSRRITFDNLALRDPVLVDRAARTFAQAAGFTPPASGPAPRPALVPLTIRSLALENRIVVSPMCQYSAKDGVPDDWHLVHLGSRAVGGAGLVFGEATAVTPAGRITPGCTGIYDDAQVVAWRRITDFVHAHSRAKVGLQIGHAGRKASCQLPWAGDGPLTDATAWPTIGPSAVPFAPTWHVPKEMTYREIDAACADFAAAAQRTRRAGFDAIELHMAHGYLLSSFISPLSNRRSDRYGGDLAGRMRFPLEVLDAVREVWPSDAPVFVRISASDWMEDGSGITDVDAVEIAKLLAAHGADVIDVSSGGTSPLGKPVYGRMYQTGFADRVRHEAGVTTMAVGGIESLDHADTVLAAGRADLCAIARAHLTDPYLALHGAAKAGSPMPEWPVQYAAVRPRRP